MLLLYVSGNSNSKTPKITAINVLFADTNNLSILWLCRILRSNGSSVIVHHIGNFSEKTKMSSDKMGFFNKLLIKKESND